MLKQRTFTDIASFFNQNCKSNRQFFLDFEKCEWINFLPFLCVIRRFLTSLLFWSKNHTSTLKTRNFQLNNVSCICKNLERTCQLNDFSNYMHALSVIATITIPFVLPNIIPTDPVPWNELFSVSYPSEVSLWVLFQRSTYVLVNWIVVIQPRQNV